VAGGEGTTGGEEQQEEREQQDQREQQESECVMQDSTIGGRRKNNFRFLFLPGQYSLELICKQMSQNGVIKRLQYYNLCEKPWRKKKKQFSIFISSSTLYRGSEVVI